MSKGWRLQWASTTQETAEAAEAFDYYRVDENIVMIYAPKAHDLFTDADDAFAASLTAEETAWLKECIDRVVIEKARKNPQKAFENDKAFMDAFEKELAKEKKALERKEEMRDGYSTEKEGGIRC